VFLSPFAPGFQFLLISLQFVSFFDGSFGERFLSIPGRSLQILVAFGPHLLKIHDFWLWVLVLSELPVSIPELPVLHRNFR